MTVTVYRFGNATIVTEQVRVVGLEGVPFTPSWRAYYDGDRARWEAGNTETEVLGKIVVSYGVRG